MVERNTGRAQEMLQPRCRLQGAHVREADGRHEGTGLERG